MAVTVQRFQKAFPEFKETEYQLIQQKLNQAILRLNATVFGDFLDDSVMLLTAHLLAISPMGEKARLNKDMSDTIYNRELKQIKKEVTIGIGRNS